MQFESLAQHFDIEIKHGLMDVLNSADSLDAVALDAYMTQHQNGLRLLAAQPEKVLECHLDKAEQLGMLVDRLVENYEHVVVDMPRRIDPYMVPVVEKVTNMVVVVQQTVSHLRDASRMMEIFDAYGVRKDQILVVLNRYDKNAPITVDDVKRAVQDVELRIIPSDFRTVSESIDLGLSMYEHSRGSAVTKALLGLEKDLRGADEEQSAGFLDKAFSKVLRKDAWFRS
jgi:pilus assembly protein CpaE